MDRSTCFWRRTLVPFVGQEKGSELFFRYPFCQNSSDPFSSQLCQGLHVVQRQLLGRSVPRSDARIPRGRGCQ